MKSELASLEIKSLIKELEGLLGGKIDQIYQLKDKDVLLAVHMPSVGRKKVRVMAPRAIFLTEASPETPEKPPNFCLQLRKHLSGAKVASIRQVNSQRIVEFEFSRPDAKYFFIIELFSKGNMVLTDEKRAIIAVAERQFWSDRKIIPGSQYAFPTQKHDFYSSDWKEILQMLHSSSRDSIVKSLAMDLGLGGIYSEEICAISGAEKLKAPAQSTEADARGIVSAIRELVSRKAIPEIIYENSQAVNAVPFRLKVYAGKESKGFDSFSQALDYYYSREFKEPSGADKKVASIQHIISEQEAMITHAESEISENTQKAEAIYRHYTTVKEVIDELGKARKKLSWKEIKDRLRNHPIVKEIDEKQGKAVVELS